MIVSGNNESVADDNVVTNPKVEMSRLIYLAWLFPLMAACGSTSLVPYGQPRASVKVINGELTFFFYRADVGVEPLGLEDKSQEARRIAIEQLFKKYPQIPPPGCTKGIELLNSGDTEGGGAIATFKCK